VEVRIRRSQVCVLERCGSFRNREPDTYRNVNWDFLFPATAHATSLAKPNCYEGGDERKKFFEG